MDNTLFICMTLPASNSQDIIALTEKDATIASVSSQILSSILHSKESDYKILVLSDGDEGETVTLPAAALRLLVDALVQMGMGKSIGIVPIKKEFELNLAP